MRGSCEPTEKLGQAAGNLEVWAAAGGPASLLEPIRGLATPIDQDGAVPARVKLLGLHLIAIIRGNDGQADSSISAAVTAGLRRDEYMDGLMAGVLSRGITVLLHGLDWVDRVPGGADGWRPDHDSEQSRHDYLREVYGDLPAWATTMADHAPGVFDAYVDLRQVVLVDGPLTRAEKELMLVSINAVERYEFGLLHHMRGAFAGGAARAEVTEAIVVGIAAGGMPAWIESAPILDRVEAEFLGEEQQRREKK